jgi:hypothetical protein
MGTDLYAITNSKLTGKETKADWDRILDALKALKLETTSIVGVDEIIKEEGDWEYEIDPYDEFFNVYYHGPFVNLPNLYSDIGVISSIYSYSSLYKLHELDWLDEWRKRLYDIVNIMGGSEIIYLADNGRNKLCKYLELMAWENVPYEEIKQKMIAEFGPPVTDYKSLDYTKLDYSNITEFFLDDFKDLK